jgi:hemolysin III
MDNQLQNSQSKQSDEVSIYSAGEELANSLSHLAGVILGFIGLLLMLKISSDSNIKLISASIYGFSIILLFMTSTIYHSVRKTSTRAFMKTLDHCAIYLLIAGTYTPFMLISLSEHGGIFYLVAIWTIALFGILFKLFMGHKYPKISLASYLLMGWFVVIAGNDMLKNVPQNGLTLLAAGGISYTVGAIFYAWKKLFFNHAIWHLFVLVGACFHFFSIYWYVLPTSHLT